MAIGDTIFIADKQTLDSTKTLLDTRTTQIISDTTTVKTLLANGATYGDTLPVTTVDETNTVVNLSGKYELLGLQISTGNVAIQIDGATNRKRIMSLSAAFVNLTGMGIKSTTSMKISCSSTGCQAIYRLLP